MRYFTIEEAEAAIPRLETIFAAAADIRGRAEAKLSSLQALESRAGYDPSQAAIERSQFEFLAEGLEETLREVQKMGAVLKGFDPGLVDFPYRLGGAEVYLCWKSGESGLTHYHGLTDGFAGRKPLPPGLRRRGTRH